MSGVSEYRAKSDSELLDLRGELRKERAKLVMQARTSGVSHNDRFKKARRDIARIATILRERKKS